MDGNGPQQEKKQIPSRLQLPSSIFFSTLNLQSLSCQFIKIDTVYSIGPECIRKRIRIGVLSVN